MTLPAQPPCLFMFVRAYYARAHCRTRFRLALRLYCAVWRHFSEVAFFGRRCSQTGEARTCGKGGPYRVHLLAAKRSRVDKARVVLRGVFELQVLFARNALNISWEQMPWLDAASMVVVEVRKCTNFAISGTACGSAS